MALRFLESLKRGGRTSRGVSSAQRYVREANTLIGDNSIQLLRRGEQAFPAMLAAIARARRTIHFETYILRSDRTGRLFQAALIERAQAGVEVRLMYDSVGSLNLVSDEFLGELAQAGVEIVEYHPITPWRRKLVERLGRLRASAAIVRGRTPPEPRVVREPGHWSFNRRNHHKILVVDDEVAFTGGINIGDEYAPGPEGGDWHDLHVRIEGPVARGLARTFHRSWLDADGDDFAPPDAPIPGASRRPVLAHHCDNFRLRNRSRMHAAYRHAIRHASRSVSIMNAYFIPDQLLRWALARAAKNGVSVRVMVPAASDVKLVWYASRYLFGRMLRAGIRIFEYQGPMMHAKAGVVDGEWATIGSFNLDRRSMLHNLEAGVVIFDAGFASQLDREFESSLEQCHEVHYSVWRERGWSQRFMEWFAHLFAYWL